MSGRRRRGLVGIASLVVVCVLSGVLCSAGWAATRYVAPSGSDGANTCLSAAAPCASFDAAYRAASAGDDVSLAAGSYGQQRINYDASKTSLSDVVFHPAAGANVTTADLLIKAKHVTIADIAVRDVFLNVNTEVITNADLTAGDITLQRLDGRTFVMMSASDVNVIGGDWGPSSACGGPYGGANNSIRQYPGGPQPTNVTIDAVTIHDVLSYDLVGCHTEGLAIFAGKNIAVRNSKFYANDVYNFLVQSNSGADPIDGVTIENNWFAASSYSAGTGNGYWAGDFSGTPKNVTIRNNSFNQAFVFSSNASYTNIQITGNIGPIAYGACTLPGVSYAYNVWQTNACSSTDVNLNGAALPYQNPTNTSTLDYHLTAITTALDLVPLRRAPATDIDGEPRLQIADAGSDEYAVASPGLPAVVDAIARVPDRYFGWISLAGRQPITPRRQLRPRRPTAKRVLYPDPARRSASAGRRQ